MTANMNRRKFLGSAAAASTFVIVPRHVLGGAKYIRQLLNRFDDNLELALAAYNAGSTKVRKYNGIPPYRSTRIYIKKVFEYYWHYQLIDQVQA